MKSFTAVVLAAIFSFGVSAQSVADAATSTDVYAPEATTTAYAPAATGSNYVAPSAAPVNTNNLYSGASEVAAFGVAAAAAIALFA
ncbi:hypothetical protein HDU98_008665 [Podochytrium sp. JEL0797]|nr:hypothetical protein HDU98_008665 [Podochytrium sp. JEL0797]